MCCADFKKAKCLMNAEVALVLQRKYEQLQQLADDPSAQISQCVINCSDHKHQQVLDANIKKYLVVLSFNLMVSILTFLSRVARTDASFTVDIDVCFLNIEVIQKTITFIKHLCRVFEKSLQYVRRFSHYQNPDAVKQVREYPSTYMYICLWWF